MSQAIYVMEQGHYRTRITLATADVKVAAKAYLEVFEDEDYFPTYDEPCMEVWRDGECIRQVEDKGMTERSLIKYLSKLGNVREL